MAKDLFAVHGRVTGAGQPTWAATHPPASADATAVERLLAAGATLVGRAHTSEMAYSLSGRDNPYGMPLNPAAPDHDPGGSSSGSAAAVAGGLADLGLGSDTLGSIRVPASYCGLYGWRPTHGRVPLDGVHPLAASLDTVGLLARDPGLLRTAAEVLTVAPPTAPVAGRVLVATEAFALLDPKITEVLLEVVDTFGPTDAVDLTADGPLSDRPDPGRAGCPGPGVRRGPPGVDRGGAPAVRPRRGRAHRPRPPGHAGSPGSGPGDPGRPPPPPRRRPAVGRRRPGPGGGATAPPRRRRPRGRRRRDESRRPCPWWRPWPACPR